MDKLITWGLVIIGLIIITGPFVFVRRKYKPLCWRHILGAYGGAGAIFLIINVAWAEFDKWLLDNVYNSGDISQALLEGIGNLTILVTLLFIASPFLAMKMKAGRLTKKNLIWSSGLALLFLILSIVVWIYLIMFGAGAFYNFN